MRKPEIAHVADEIAFADFAAETRIVVPLFCDTRRGQSADAIVERLASKYAPRFEITVATSDSLVKETVNASGASCVSPEGLRKLLEEIGKR